MTFKQFMAWCNERACDGCWSFNVATFCIEIIRDVKKQPFWRREGENMKAVMISIRPEWCEKIASGEKTVEVRKTRPKIEPPFKCYIYCTKDKEKLWVSRGSERAFTREKIAAICQAKDVGGAYQGNGKVIGEFMCDVVITAEHGRYVVLNSHDTQIESLDLCDYADGKTVYGWNISELVIYDHPKELSEFCSYDARTYIGENGYPMPTHEITRPPQSWFYVE